MRCAVIVFGVVTAAAVGADEKTRELTFDKGDVGKLPAGWAAAKTGKGEGSVWKVAADATAPSKSGHALAQTAEGPSQLYNLCVVEGSSFKDVELSVAVRAVAGTIDQGGGLVWRYKDADNYYVCRYNPLELNFRLYHIKGGKRTQLQTREKLELPEGKWFTVAVRHAGNRIECSINGTKYLEATDDTFPDAGRVGLWTKADAQTHFDQLRIAPAGK